MWLCSYRAVLVTCSLCLVNGASYVAESKVLDDMKQHYKLTSFTNIVYKSRYLDLVFVGDDHNSINVRTYEQQNNTYSEPDGYQYSFKSNVNFTDFKIIGLLPADFNNDKTTDLMVAFANTKSHGDYKLSILWNKDNKFSSLPTNFDNKFVSIPHLLDYNGDMLVDFICAEKDSRFFYINNPDKPGTFNAKEIKEDFEIDMSKSEMAYVYADLNGDCAADLFMITRLKNGTSVFEFYLADGKELKLDRVIPVPELAKSDQYGVPLAVDMDGNGKLDIVIPGCGGHISSDHQCGESKIFTFYNDPCHPNSAEKCEKYESPCEKTYNFKMDDLNVFDKFEHNKNRYGFIHYDKSDIFSSLFMLRAVDYDSDGHMDLVSVLKYDKRQQVVFLKNIPDPSVAGGHTFQPTWRDDVIIASPRSTIYEPYAIAPVDAIGIGNPQFFLVGRSIDNPNDFSFDLYVNSRTLDTFWFKITVLCEKCEESSTTLIGASAFYSTTGVKGEDEVGYGMQSTQVTVNSLQAPYILFGLGEQANYIEWLKVAYRKAGAGTTGKRNNIEMTRFDNIIPNAQVFAIPKGSNDWKLVMLVVPGKLLWETLIVLGVCCLVCLIIILALHIKEKREDERDKIKFNNKFNFGAM